MRNATFDMGNGSATDGITFTVNPFLAQLGALVTHKWAADEYDWGLLPWASGRLAHHACTYATVNHLGDLRIFRCGWSLVSHNLRWLVFVLKAASEEHYVIRMHYGDMGFVCLLVYWVYKIIVKPNIQIVNRGEGFCTSHLHARTSLPSDFSC